MHSRRNDGGYELNTPSKLIAGLAATALVLTACSGGGGAEGGNGSTTVEFWTSYSPGEDAEAATLEMIEKFEESTECTVNQSNFNYDMMRDKLVASAAGGNLPDVWWGLPEWVGEFYKLGVLADLTEVWNGWEDAGDVSDANKNAMMIDGKIIGLPYEATTRALLVHDDLLAEAGVDVPATWDDVIASANTVQDATGTFAYGVAAAGVRSPQELIVYLAQKGLVVAAEQDGGGFRNTWAENPDELAAAAEVFDFYKELLDSGAVSPNSATYGWEETDENFATAMTATYVTGNWLGERETSNPDTMMDISIHPVPVPADGVPATYLESKPLMVSANSDAMDCAAQLAVAAASEEWQNAVHQSRSALSSVSADTKWSSDFQALQEYGVTFPPVALGGVTQAMIDALAMVLQEGQESAAAAQWLSDEINASLEASGDLAE